MQYIAHCDDAVTLRRNVLYAYNIEMRRNLRCDYRPLLQMSPIKRDYILQKRPIILRSLLIENIEMPSNLRCDHIAQCDA